jgi:uncharacterized membrane protein
MYRKAHSDSFTQPPTGIRLLLLVLMPFACAGPPSSVEPPAQAAIVNQAPGHRGIDLNFLPRGINNDGVVVGQRDIYAVWYRGGVTTPLPAPNSLRHLAIDVNDQGAVVGKGKRDLAQHGGQEVEIGLFWPKPDQPPLHILPPGFGAITPVAINNANVVAGNYTTEDGNSHGFLWSPTEGFRDVHPLDHQLSVVSAMNDAGYLVGYGLRPNDEKIHALRWSPAGVATVLPGLNSHATAVLANGDAVGVINQLSATEQTVRWDANGATHPVVIPHPGRVDDASTAGRLVGTTFGSATPPWRPWTSRQGVFTWLPVPNQVDGDAVSGLRVNAVGAIIGAHSLPGGSVRGILWKAPTSVSVSVSPEYIFSGESVALTAVVTAGPDGGIPSGRVLFSITGRHPFPPVRIRPPATLSQGQAAAESPPIEAPSGSPLTSRAGYGGDANFASSQGQAALWVY